MELDRIIERYDLDKDKILNIINKLCERDNSEKFFIDIMCYLIIAFNEGKSASTLGYNLLELMEEINIIDNFYECIEGDYYKN